MIIVRLDHDRKSLIADQHEVTLTPREYAICDYLMRRPGVVRTRTELLDECGWEVHVQERVVDSVIKRLRQKLRACALEPIEGRYGFGYVWRDSF